MGVDYQTVLNTGCLSLLNIVSSQQGIRECCTFSTPTKHTSMRHPNPHPHSFSLLMRSTLLAADVGARLTQPLQRFHHASGGLHVVPLCCTISTLLKAEIDSSGSKPRSVNSQSLCVLNFFALMGRPRLNTRLTTGCTYLSCSIS